jgi:putative ABC transport system permease protein
MRFLAELALRDLRASGRSLWVFCACLVLGVALVAATGGLYRLVNLSLLADTRVLLGGDVEVDTYEPLPDVALSWIKANGEVSLVTEVDTMLGNADDQFLRVELQTTDSLYPLYGELVLAPPKSLDDIIAFVDGYWGVAIDPVLAEQLNIGIDASVFIGSLEMKVRALVINQPDRSLNANWRGTPVLLSADALQASELIQPGSIIDYEYQVRTSMPAEIWRTRLYEAFPNEVWEVRTFSDRGQRLAERLGQIASGLLIIGFSTLFIGGLGVFNSIQAYLQGKLKTIATLRSLGLRNRPLVVVYLLQVGILSGGASVLGALIGSGLAVLGGEVVASQLPIAANITSLIVPCLIAISFGLLTAFTFTFPALGRALATEPAVLFRGQGQASSRVPRRWWLATFIGAVMIVLLVLQVLPDSLFGVGFVLVIGAVLLILDLMVRGIRRVAQSLDNHPLLSNRFELRLAMANLYRQGSSLRSSLLSLGSALTLLVACTLVVAALLRSVHETIPEESPGLVIYGLFNAQIDAVASAIEQLPGAARIEIAPLVRARITALNGRDLAQINDLADAQRRDSSQDRYKLSYLGNNIDDVSLVDGAWWSGSTVGLPKLAFEDREARKLDLQVGDLVTFTVEGRNFDTEVAAIYSQKGVQTRFWFEGILSAGALDEFIHQHVGAVYVDDTDAISAQKSIADIAPNVITVRTASVLKVARQILGKAGVGLAVVAAVSLFASLLVLISVMAAGRSRQIYDATILHSLGVRLSSIKRSLQLEYLLLALIASVFAVVLGSAIALPILQWRLKLPSADLIWLGAVVAISVSSLALGIGATYILGRLRIRPAVLLRSPS